MFGCWAFVLINGAFQNFHRAQADEDHIKVAITEYHPYFFDPRLPSTPAELLNHNLDRFVLPSVKKAASKSPPPQADLLVFPENGITGYKSGVYDRELMRKLCIELPNPKDYADAYAGQWAPFKNSDPLDPENQILREFEKYQHHGVLKRLSQFAHDHEIYLAYNIGTYFHGDDHQYNTNLVFDDHGQLLLAYQKMNLYGETDLFDTPNFCAEESFGVKGVTFGVLICADLGYQFPSKNYLNRGIRHFIAPVYWTDTMAEMSPIPYFSSWAKQNEAYLVVSQLRTSENSGSAIMSPGGYSVVTINHYPLRGDDASRGPDVVIGRVTKYVTTRPPRVDLPSGNFEYVLDGGDWPVPDFPRKEPDWVRRNWATKPMTFSCIGSSEIDRGGVRVEEVCSPKAEGSDEHVCCRVTFEFQVQQVDSIRVGMNVYVQDSNGAFVVPRIVESILIEYPNGSQDHHEREFLGLWEVSQAQDNLHASVRDRQKKYRLKVDTADGQVFEDRDRSEFASSADLNEIELTVAADKIDNDFTINNEGKLRISDYPSFQEGAGRIVLGIASIRDDSGSGQQSMVETWVDLKSALKKHDCANRCRIILKDWSPYLLAAFHGTDEEGAMDSPMYLTSCAVLPSTGTWKHDAIRFKSVKVEATSTPYTIPPGNTFFLVPTWLDDAQSLNPDAYTTDVTNWSLDVPDAFDARGAVIFNRDYHRDHRPYDGRCGIKQAHEFETKIHVPARSAKPKSGAADPVELRRVGDDFYTRAVATAA